MRRTLAALLLCGCASTPVPMLRSSDLSTRPTVDGRPADALYETSSSLEALRRFYLDAKILSLHEDQRPFITTTLDRLTNRLVGCYVVKDGKPRNVPIQDLRALDREAESKKSDVALARQRLTAHAKAYLSARPQHDWCGWLLGDNVPLFELVGDEYVRRK